MHKYTYVILIIAVLVIIYKFSTWNTPAHENYLYGFWVAEGDEFCKNAEIESILIFIGEADAGWISSTRTCYIIIMNDMCNQGFTITYNHGWASAGIGKYHITANVVFDDEQIWTDRVNIDVDMRDGTMKISSDDGKTMYAMLTKQHDTTNLARSAEDAELVADTSADSAAD